MTNLEMRDAKRQLEAALLRAFQTEVSKFQEMTALNVTSIEVEITTTTTLGVSAKSYYVTRVKVRAEL